MKTGQQYPRFALCTGVLLAAVGFQLGISHEGVAYGAQVRSVQRTSYVLAKENLEKTQSLGKPVDPSRTLILSSASFDEPQAVFSNASNAMKFETYLKDDETLKTVRPLNGVEGEIHVELVEFESGVRVYRGITYFGAGTYIKKIKLPDFDPKKSFPVLEASPLDGEEPPGSHGFFMASFSGTDTLKIEREEPVKLRIIDSETAASRIENQPMPAMRVAWQVVEMDGARVESGIAKIPHFSAETNAYLLDSVDDMKRAVLLFYSTAGSRTEGRQHLTAVRGSITEKDSLSFFRGSAGEESGEGIDITWFVLQFEEGQGKVQNGIVRFEANESIKKIPLEKMDPSRSFSLLNFSFPGSLEDRKAGGNNSSFAADLSDSHSLLIKRGSDEVLSVPAEVAWQVVELPLISMDEPAEGDVWTVGAARRIAWRHSSSALEGGTGRDGEHQLKLYLSLEGGKDQYPYLIAKNIPVSSRHFPWTIPENIQGINPIGKDLKIKITDLDQEDAMCFSGTFKAIGQLKLLLPVGGEKWDSGSEAQEIKWKYQGDIGSVSLYYDTNSGFGPEAFPEKNKIASVPAGKKGEGLYLWQIPPELHSYNVKIKLVQTSDAEVFDVSFNDFSITPTLEILQPNTGEESWIADSYHFVQWKTSGLIKRLNLFYAHGKEGAWQLAAKDIEGGPPGIGGFRWLVPKAAIGEAVRIKLTDAGDSKVTDQAPDGTDQTIEVISWVRLKESAIANEILHVGEVKVIEWEYGGQIEFFNIEYSRDGGSHWHQVAYVPAGDKIYHWTVPDDISAEIRLRISHVKNPKLNDISDTPMEIKGSLKLLKPSGGETWLRDGTEREVEWSSAGRIGTVSIYYDEQSGAGGFPPHHLLAGQIDSKAGRVVLKTIPDLHSNKIRLRIIQDADPELFDTAPDDLTILPAIEIKEPIAGSTVLLGGKAARITWGTTGTLDSFVVLYREEEGAWQMIQADVPGGPAGTYTYQWRIPEELLGSRLHFRVESTLEPKTAAATTRGPAFAVESWINLVGSLLDHLSYVPGQPLIINWELSRDIRFVRLQYSLDKGASWEDIAVAKAEDGYFKWVVPAEVQGEVLVSVRDLNRKQILDISPTLKRHQLPHPITSKPDASV